MEVTLQPCTESADLLASIKLGTTVHLRIDDGAGELQCVDSNGIVLAKAARTPRSVPRQTEATVRAVRRGPSGQVTQVAVRLTKSSSAAEGGAEARSWGRASQVANAWTSGRWTPNKSEGSSKVVAQTPAQIQAHAPQKSQTARPRLAATSASSKSASGRSQPPTYTQNLQLSDILLEAIRAKQQAATKTRTSDDESELSPRELSRKHIARRLERLRQRTGTQGPAKSQAKVDVSAFTYRLGARSTRHAVQDALTDTNLSESDLSTDPGTRSAPTAAAAKRRYSGIKRRSKLTPLKKKILMERCSKALEKVQQARRTAESALQTVTAEVVRLEGELGESQAALGAISNPSTQQEVGMQVLTLALGEAKKQQQAAWEAAEMQQAKWQRCYEDYAEMVKHKSEGPGHVSAGNLTDGSEVSSSMLLRVYESTQHVSATGASSPWREVARGALTSDGYDRRAGTTHRGEGEGSGTGYCDDGGGFNMGPVSNLTDCNADLPCDVLQAPENTKNHSACLSTDTPVTEGVADTLEHLKTVLGPGVGGPQPGLALYEGSTSMGDHERAPADARAVTRVPSEDVIATAPMSTIPLTSVTPIGPTDSLETTATSQASTGLPAASTSTTSAAHLGSMRLHRRRIMTELGLDEDGAISESSGFESDAQSLSAGLRSPAVSGVSWGVSPIATTSTEVKTEMSLYPPARAHGSRERQDQSCLWPICSWEGESSDGSEESATGAHTLSDWNDTVSTWASNMPWQGSIWAQPSASSRRRKTVAMRASSTATTLQSTSLTEVNETLPVRGHPHTQKLINSCTAATAPCQAVASRVTNSIQVPAPRPGVDMVTKNTLVPALKQSMERVIKIDCPESLAVSQSAMCVVAAKAQVLEPDFTNGMPPIHARPPTTNQDSNQAALRPTVPDVSAESVGASTQRGGYSTMQSINAAGAELLASRTPTAVQHTLPAGSVTLSSFGVTKSEPPAGTGSTAAGQQQTAVKPSEWTGGPTACPTNDSASRITSAIISTTQRDSASYAAAGAATPYVGVGTPSYVVGGTPGYPVQSSGVAQLSPDATGRPTGRDTALPVMGKAHVLTASAAAANPVLVNQWAHAATSHGLGLYMQPRSRTVAESGRTMQGSGSNTPGTGSKITQSAYSLTAPGGTIPGSTMPGTRGTTQESSSTKLGSGMMFGSGSTLLGSGNTVSGRGSTAHGTLHMGGLIQQVGGLMGGDNHEDESSEGSEDDDSTVLQRWAGAANAKVNIFRVAASSNQSGAQYTAGIAAAKSTSFQPASQQRIAGTPAATLPSFPPASQQGAGTPAALMSALRSASKHHIFVPSNSAAAHLAFSRSPVTHTPSPQAEAVQAQGLTSQQQSAGSTAAGRNQNRERIVLGPSPLHSGASPGKVVPQQGKQLSSSSTQSQEMSLKRALGMSAAMGTAPEARGGVTAIITASSTAMQQSTAPSKPPYLGAVAESLRAAGLTATADSHGHPTAHMMRLTHSEDVNQSHGAGNCGGVRSAAGLLSTGPAFDESFHLIRIEPPLVHSADSARQAQPPHSWSASQQSPQSASVETPASTQLPPTQSCSVNQQILQTSSIGTPASPQPPPSQSWLASQQSVQPMGMVSPASPRPQLIGRVLSQNQIKSQSQNKSQNQHQSQSQSQSQSQPTMSATINSTSVAEGHAEVGWSSSAAGPASDNLRLQKQLAPEGHRERDRAYLREGQSTGRCSGQPGTTSIGLGKDPSLHSSVADATAPNHAASAAMGSTGAPAAPIECTMSQPHMTGQLPCTQDVERGSQVPAETSHGSSSPRGAFKDNPVLGSGSAHEGQALDRPHANAASSVNPPCDSPDLDGGTGPGHESTALRSAAVAHPKDRVYPTDHAKGSIPCDSVAASSGVNMAGASIRKGENQRSDAESDSGAAPHLVNDGDDEPLKEDKVQDKVQQAVAREEWAKDDGSQGVVTRSAGPEGPPWRCEVCNVTCNSKGGLDQHLSSKRHLARATRQAMEPVAQVAVLVQQLNEGGQIPATYVGPNARLPPYCHQLITPELNDLVSELLLQTRGFQERAFAKNPVKAQMHRWYVQGLREVSKSAKLCKAQCVILAPNIEHHGPEGALQDTVGGLLDLCSKNNIPVLFALSRKKLGDIYCCRKRMSAVALLDTAGVKDLYCRILALVDDLRQQYKAQQADKQAAEQSSSTPVL